MYNSAFYKHDAKERLSGCYATAVICAMIFMLPQYLLSRIITAVDFAFSGSFMLSEIIALLIQVFVINIFEIGFIRFLLRMRPTDQSGRKSYDYNLILSGYTTNFGATLGTTSMVLVKLFFLLLLAAVPTIAVILFITMYVPTDVLSRIGSAIYEASLSPSQQAIAELSLLIDKSFPHLSLFTGIYLLTTVGAAVPFIYKAYEYKMVPFILADDTEVTYRSTMKRTRDIMDGYRWKFFIVQFSFFLYALLISLLLAVTGSMLIYCAAYAILLPYQYMTYAEFYRQRNGVISHNINTYGEQEI